MTEQSKPVKVAFVGGPGAGKSLIRAAVYSELKKKGFSVFSPEEGATQFIRHCGSPQSVSDSFVIMHLQAENEKEMMEIQNCDFVLCDCATFLSCVYAKLQEADSKNKKHHNFISEMMRKFYRRGLHTYDYIFYLPIEHSFNPADGIRYHNVDEANGVAKQIKAFLDSEIIRYFEIKGTLDERVNKTLEILKGNVVA